MLPLVPDQEVSTFIRFTVQCHFTTLWGSFRQGGGVEISQGSRLRSGSISPLGWNLLFFPRDIQRKHKQYVFGNVCSIPLISAGRNYSDLKQKHDILHIQSGYRDERTIVSRLAFSVLADVDILHTILGGQSLLPDAFERTVDWRWRLF
jgi:hypothetical protein